MSVIVKSAGGGSIMKNNTLGIASYLTFVGSESIDAKDAALGKNNEDRVKGVGLALAMYARFKDPTIDIKTTFPNLIKLNTTEEMFSNPDAVREMKSNENILNLVQKSFLSEEFDYVLKQINVLDEGYIWEFTKSGTYNLPLLQDTPLDICLIGGGGAGGGGSTSYGGGGGGGSGFMENYTDITLSSLMNVVIGAGGEAAGSNGGTTSVTINGVVYTAEGGSCGTNGNGGNGGSGGGAGSSLTGQSTGGIGGSNGSDGFTSTAGSHTVGTGDGKSKYPFGNTALTLYCGGGGGAGGYSGAGGDGGGGAGSGGSSSGKGSNGTLYGAGGGGSHWNGPANVGKGYQGAVLIRKHVE